MERGAHHCLGQCPDGRFVFTRLVSSLGTLDSQLPEFLVAADLQKEGF